jgi:hypothetical protein
LGRKVDGVEQKKRARLLRDLWMQEVGQARTVARDLGRRRKF